MFLVPPWGGGPRLRGRGMFLALVPLPNLRNIPLFAPANHPPLKGGPGQRAHVAPMNIISNGLCVETMKGQECRRQTFAAG